VRVCVGGGGEGGRRVGRKEGTISLHTGQTHMQQSEALNDTHTKGEEGDESHMCTRSPLSPFPVTLSQTPTEEEMDGGIDVPDTDPDTTAGSRLARRWSAEAVDSPVSEDRSLVPIGKRRVRRRLAARGSCRVLIAAIPVEDLPVGRLREAAVGSCWGIGHRDSRNCCQEVEDSL